VVGTGFRMTFNTHYWLMKKIALFLSEPAYLRIAAARYTAGTLKGSAVMFLFMSFVFLFTSCGSVNKSSGTATAQTPDREIEPTSMKDSTSAQYFKNYLQASDPAVKGSWLWITDEQLQPLTGAEVIVPGKRLTIDENGICLLDALAPGNYTIEVRKAGLEPQIVYAELNGSAPFRRRVIPGRLGAVYFPSVYGFFPLYDTDEHVSLHQQNSGEPYLKEIDRLKVDFPQDASVSGNSPGCFKVPQEPSERSRFISVLEHNSAAKISELYVFGPCGTTLGVTEFAEFRISRKTDSETLKAAFEKAGFEIMKTVDWTLSGGPSWRITTRYKLPVTTTYLEALRHIAETLPVISIQPDYIQKENH